MTKEGSGVFFFFWLEKIQRWLCTYTYLCGNNLYSSALCKDKKNMTAPSHLPLAHSPFPSSFHSPLHPTHGANPMNPSWYHQLGLSISPSGPRPDREFVFFRSPPRQIFIRSRQGHSFLQGFLQKPGCCELYSQSLTVTYTTCTAFSDTASNRSQSDNSEAHSCKHSSTILISHVVVGWVYCCLFLAGGGDAAAARAPKRRRE